jgi:Fe-S cluster assembly protein SufD
VAKPRSLPTLDGVTITVSPNGHLECSDTLPTGVTVRTFDALDHTEANDLSRLLETGVADRSGLIRDVSNATCTVGLWIEVSKDVQVDLPLTVVWDLSLGGAWMSSQLVVRLQRGAQVSIVEQFSSSDQTLCHQHGLTDLFLCDGANLDYVRLGDFAPTTYFLGGVFASLARDAQLSAFAYTQGANLSRNEVGVRFDAPGAHADVNGVYLPRGREVVDFHTTLEHAAEHCTSNETFRGIVGDHANAVFNGRIHIHEGAQKTVAQLSNKNLLTSDTAQVNTKPELEIYANDVQCAHGATVAQLNDEAVHYLRSRGVSKEVAVQLISIGFVETLFERVRHESVRDWLRQQTRVRCDSPSNVSVAP